MCEILAFSDTDAHLSTLSHSNYMSESM